MKMFTLLMAEQSTHTVHFSSCRSYIKLRWNILQANISNIYTLSGLDSSSPTVFSGTTMMQTHVNKGTAMNMCPCWEAAIVSDTFQHILTASTSSSCPGLSCLCQTRGLLLLSPGNRPTGWLRCWSVPPGFHCELLEAGVRSAAASPDKTLRLSAAPAVLLLPCPYHHLKDKTPDTTRTLKHILKYKTKLNKLVANSCLSTHQAATEQHDSLFGVMFVSRWTQVQYCSSFTSFLVSTDCWRKFLSP